MTRAVVRAPAPLPAARATERPALRILLLATAHNSLSQRVLVALREHGHRVTVAVVDSGAAIEAAVARDPADLIVCPMLKTFIPDSVWQRHRCLVVHPGPPGDRGPSSLDWAIELGAAAWGVTVLEASGEVDGGAVWAARTFPIRAAGKSSLYRHEVRRGAIEAVVEAVTAVAAGAPAGKALDSGDPRVVGRLRPQMRQAERAIDWRADATATIVRRMRASEGHPGVLDTIEGVAFHLFGVHREDALRGEPGQIVARRHGAICRATVDSAVWITHLKRPGHFKLPATHALAAAAVELDVPEVPVALHGETRATFRELAYEQRGAVGYLHFDFYNGAMSRDQSRRLLEAYRYARGRDTRVIVLMGGADFFSNGIHLNVIEAARDPAAESWLNLHAIDDVVRAVIETDSQLVVSALTGDAAAGGVPLALAADHVLAREDVVLNPYYRHMGGLYGSEYWTYLLPRRVGADMTARLTAAPFEPVGARRAVAIGLLDDAFGMTAARFRAGVRRFAARLAADPALPGRLAEKRRSRARDEQRKPLATYRAEELARSHACFFGADRSYHEARRRFVYKLGAAGAAPAPSRPPRCVECSSVRAIAEDVWQLPLMPRDALNAFVIGDVLVDTGLKQSASKLAAVFEERTIAAIALTHAHGDHAGSVRDLAERFGVPVWCGEADRQATETGRLVLAAPLRRPRLAMLAGAAGGFDGTPVARTLREGDPLAAGFIVLDTPGHSPGHVSFWRERDRTLICGDVFFNLRLPSLRPGLREPPALLTPDAAQNRNSERRLAALEPSSVGFGHGPVLSDAARTLDDFVRALPPG